MIFGTRYTCLRCPDYDLCFKCYRRVNLHGPDHPFKVREMSDDAEAGRTFIEVIEEIEGGEGSRDRGQFSSVFNDSNEQSSGS